jgi:protein-S-isoprenylcysteine O-methyltransferase Ste14
LHSWLASTGAKQAAENSLGLLAPRLYRLIYNLVSLVTLAPIGTLLVSTPDKLLYAAVPPLSWMMRGLQLAAIILGAAAVLQSGALHFAGLAQIFEPKRASTLSTSGFYKWVRHPLYLLGLIMLWLSPTMSVNQLTVSAVFSAYLFIGARFEEKRLIREFGEKYLDYRKRTPMIIPWFSAKDVSHTR